MSPQTQQKLWASVQQRDRSADGLFVYAVRSTGIVCRPSCPSRRPARHRVEFFPHVALAIDAGYRACRRCRPDREQSALDTPLVRACQAIHVRPETTWSSAALSAVAHVPAPTLRRAFRRALGLTPREYVSACRRRRFLQALRVGTPVARAIYDSGYASPSGVYGGPTGSVTPASYRRGGQGAAVTWMTSRSPLGRVLVAATPRGACFVAIGRSDADLQSALRAELPRAHLTKRPTAPLRRLLAVATAVAAARPISVTVPADIAGTAFEWRVWRALTSIPRGRTMTYRELARAVGSPNAVRAAGRACATNPLALIVPCHRVVGSDGSLRGYRWGLDVKERLLEVEGQ